MPEPEDSMIAARQNLGLLHELMGTACRCGHVKQARQTFCSTCYCKLPRGMRTALYNRFGSGYEEAYAAAVGCLVEAGS